MRTYPELESKFQDYCSRIGSASPLIQVVNDAVDEPWVIGFVIYLLETTLNQSVQQHADLAKRLQRLRRLLIHSWNEQGRPGVKDFVLNLAALSENDAKFASQQLRTIGLAVDRAITAGQVPRELMDVAQMLLPHHTRKSGGWANLVIPEETMLLLVRRSGSASAFEVNPEYAEICTLLCHYRHERWAMTVICIAIALMGDRKSNGRERNTPKSIVTLLKKVACVLKCSFRARSLHAARELKNSDLVNFLSGAYGGPGPLTRHSQISAYLYCVDALMRLRVNCKRNEILPIDCYFLPKLAVPAGLLSKPHKTLRSDRRSSQIRGATVNYHLLRSLIIQRSAIMNYILREQKEAEEAVRNGAGPVELNIELADGSATLHFILDSYQRMYVERYSGDSRRAIPSPGGDTIITKYCGATRNGVILTETPFFVDYLARRYTRFLAQEELNGHPISDYKSSISGLITPPAASSLFVRKLSESEMLRGNPSGIYFSLEAVCAASAFGNLVIMLASGSGARIHELQQIKIEKYHYGLLENGRIWINIYGKGQKRDKALLTKHILESDIKSLWRAVIHNNGSEKGNLDIVKMQGGSAYAIPAGRLFFQWNGRALLEIDLNLLLRFAAHGTCLIDPISGQRISLTSCLFRAAYAQARKKAGHSKKAIQNALNHTEAQMTDHYLRGEASLPSLLQPPKLSDWDALIGRYVL